MTAMVFLRSFIVALLLTGAVYYFFHDTFFDEWQKDNEKKLAEIQKLEKENQQLAQLEKRLDEIRAEQVRLENAIRELQLRLPNQEQFGQIIQDFTSAAKERQLTLFIQARPPAKRDGVQSGQLQFSVDSLSEGGYQRVRSFADWIRDYPRLISFQRFEAAVGNDGRIGLSGTCQTPVMFDVLLPPLSPAPPSTVPSPDSSPPSASSPAAPPPGTPPPAAPSPAAPPPGTPPPAAPSPSASPPATPPPAAPSPSAPPPATPPPAVPSPVSPPPRAPSPVTPPPQAPRSSLRPVPSPGVVVQSHRPSDKAHGQNCSQSMSYNNQQVTLSLADQTNCMANFLSLWIHEKNSTVEVIDTAGTGTPFRLVCVTNRQSEVGGKLFRYGSQEPLCENSYPFGCCI